MSFIVSLSAVRIGGRKMNRYFSKALFYTEKKNLINSMLAYSLIYVYGIVYLIGALNESQKYKTLPPNPTDIFGSSIFLFIAICLTSVIYSYSEKHKKYNFMLTQTYSRDSIVITKTISFVLCYLIPTIIYGILAFIILAINKNHFIGDPWGNYYNEVVSKLLLGILCIIAVMSFLTLVLEFFQMCFGNCIAGVILPVIMAAILSLSSSIIGQFISNKLGALRSYWHNFNNLQFNSVTASNGSISYKSLQQLITEYLHYFNISVSLILIAISVLLFYACILLNRKIKVESTANLFLYNFTEISFKAVFSLFITVTGSLIIFGILYYLGSSVIGMNCSTYLINKHGLQGKENIEHTIYLVLNILWIPLFAFVYKVFGLILNKRRTL